MKAKLVMYEQTPLQKVDWRYSDKYGHKAMLASIVARHKCYKCDGLVFAWDPDDHNYLKCHKCGTRKTVPLNYPKITSTQWIEEMKLRDCFTIFSKGVRINEE